MGLLDKNKELIMKMPKESRYGRGGGGGGGGGSRWMSTKN